MFVGFFTSCILLNQLGVVNFGVYNVLGGINVLFGFLNQLEEGIEKAVRWYLENQVWMIDIALGGYEKYYESMYKERK